MERRDPGEWVIYGGSGFYVELPRWIERHAVEVPDDQIDGYVRGVMDVVHALKSTQFVFERAK